MNATITGSLAAPANIENDRLIGARLLGWLTLEAGKSNWWVIAPDSQGRVVEWDSTGGAGMPYRVPKDRMYYALRVCQALAALRMPGVWIVAWMDDCKRFYLLFKDSDGDIQIPIECDKSWLLIRDWTMADWQQHAEMAFKQWREHWAQVEVEDNQTIQLAKGQVSRFMQ